MKKLMKVLVCVAIIFSVVACSSKSNDKIKVGIVQIIDHASLNTIREATIKQLESSSFDIEIIYKNAGGDKTVLSTICQQFKEQGVDVIVAIATPSAQVAANYSDEIPVVFSAVTDPVAAKLVQNPEAPEGNITGTSDEIQIDLILDLAKEMYPDMKSVGFLYNSGEMNSVSNLKKVEAYTKANKLELIQGAFTSTSEIQSATQMLLDKVDVVFTPNDNSVASAMDIVSNLAIEAKKPLFVGADSMVKDGGLATVGIDYEELGKETANMVIQILEDTPISKIPVKVFKEDLNVYLNTRVAGAIGFDKVDALKANHTLIEVK